MLVVVEVWAEDLERPPEGIPVRVEARDTSLADAPSEVIAAADGTVRGRLGKWLETVELSLPRVPAVCTIWAHVDVDRDGRVSAGDLITVASYPVPAREEARVQVGVRKV